MNQTLAARGMRVQVKAQQGYYKLLVEGEQLPPQAATAKWIEKGIAQLDIAQLKGIAVYGKARSHPKPAWQCTLPANSLRKKPASKPTELSSAPAEPSVNTDQSCSPTVHSDSTLDLSEYCFTRNQSLLKGKLTLPAKPVIEAVLAFAALHPGQQLAVLPHLEKLFRKPAPIEDDALCPDGKAWIESMNAMEGNDRRKLSIWLSRYCLNASETLAQLRPPEPEPEPEADADLDEQDADFPAVEGAAAYSGASSTRRRSAPTASPSNFVAPSATQKRRAQETTLNHSGSLPVWLVPAIWAVGLTIAIALGVRSARAVPHTYEICAGSAQVEYCELAVQLTGDEETLAEIVETAEPIPTDLHQKAVTACSEEGYDISSPIPLGTSFRPNPEDAITIQSETSVEVLPGLLLTDLIQSDSNADGLTTRVACLDSGYTYEVSDGLSSEAVNYSGLSEVSMDELPMTWPEESYDVIAERTLSVEEALGVHNVFITFGGTTLFTAIGLFVAVLLNSCYSCRSFSRIYQMAAAVGFIEAILPLRAGLTGAMAINITVIGIASCFVKDFNVDWKEGFGPLALGALTIIIIRWVLHMLLYVSIEAMIF